MDPSSHGQQRHSRGYRVVLNNTPDCTEMLRCLNDWATRADDAYGYQYITMLVSAAITEAVANRFPRCAPHVVETRADSFLTNVWFRLYEMNCPYCPSLAPLRLLANLFSPPPPAIAQRIPFPQLRHREAQEALVMMKLATCEASLCRIRTID